MKESGRGVHLKNGKIIFGNLINAGDVTTGKSVFTTAEPADAVQRSNAKGDLREIENFSHASALGTEAALEFKALLKL
jgi:hypothetical protein